ncbi:MAG: hypothetical protein JSR67_06055 [Proteobacteria bacterium]|nr:hypothetical protein [Pseudomonadota bacterium]
MIRITLLTIIAAGLAACGGGGSGSSMPSTGPAPSASGPGPVVTSGTITAFGSVYVNAVRYDVSAATIRKNGSAVPQSGLAVGEVALVTGQQNPQTGQGTASDVDVEDSVVGPIAAIGTGQLTVLGQTVLVGASTSFGAGITPADLGGLKVGDAIEVSGLAASAGVNATRITRAQPGEPLQVIGTVSNLVTATHSFALNGLTVDFSAATLSGFAAGGPANGNVVLARGGTFDATLVRLTAAAVMAGVTDPRETTFAGRAEQEGVITRFVSAVDFDVSGFKTTTTSTTVYLNGTVADLALNARVVVRGTVNASAVLVADSVTFEPVAALAVLAPLTAAPAGNSFTLLGVVITVDANTRFEDKESGGLQTFTLGNVNVGDSLLVRGYESPTGSGRILATRVEREPPQTTVMVRGLFASPAPPLFRILGITIDTTSATFGYEEGAGLSAVQFFAQAAGQAVEVEGTAVGNTVNASSVLIDTGVDQ